MNARYGTLILAVAVSMLVGRDLQTQQVPQPRTGNARVSPGAHAAASYTLGAFVAECGELLEVVLESTAAGQSLALYDENHDRVEVRANGRDGSIAIVTRSSVTVISPPADSIAQRPGHRRWRTNRMLRRECRNQPH